MVYSTKDIAGDTYKKAGNGNGMRLAKRQLFRYTGSCYMLKKIPL
jgi:hypothetical protein